MAASATQPTSYLSDPNATAAYQKALAGAADLYSQYGGSNAPVYNTQTATQWANTVPGLLAAQTPYQVNAAQQMGNLQGYMNQFTNPALGYATSSAVPINQYQVGQSQIDQYMSPYLNNVMQSAVANINETNAQQQQQLLGNAISKGAFGGDRAGIAQAALARQQNLSNNATLANILNTGYGQALGEANQQQGVAYGAQIANNQMANAAANLLSNLGTQGQSAQLQQLQAQYNMGAAQQTQDQNAKNIAYQQYQNYMQQPYQQAKYLADMASGASSALGGTTVASIPQPSTVSQIAGGIGALAGQDFSGISNLFKNRGGSVRGSYATGGRMGYADGGTPTAGQQLSDAYATYTQAARTGADLPTLKSLYNNYINVKNSTEAGGANIGQSDLGNQIRGYQYPTAQSLENANNSSAGGIAAIAGMLAKLLAAQKKGGGGGGGGAQVPKSEAKPAQTQQAKPAQINPNSGTNAGTNALNRLAGPTGLGNTETANSYLNASNLPGVSMANVIKDNPNFNAALATEAAVPHVMPASAGGQNMPVTYDASNPYAFATAARTLDANGNLLPNAVNNLNNSPVSMGGKFVDANSFSNMSYPTVTTNPSNIGVGNISGVNSAFGVNGAQGVSPVQNVVEKAQQEQARAMDQRDQPSASDILAAAPSQAIGAGGQLSGLSNLSNSQAIEAASQLGLNNLSPDQLIAAGFTPDQAMAIGASNAMPPPDQGVSPVIGGNVAAQREQDVLAPSESGQPSAQTTSQTAAPASLGSQEVWNNSYDLALANGMSDVQAINYADTAAAATTQLDTAQPTVTNSSGQTVDALGNPIRPTAAVQPDYSSVNPSDYYQSPSPTVSDQTASNQSYNYGTSGGGGGYDSSFQAPDYVAPAPLDTGPSYQGVTYDPSSTYNQFVAPDYSYTPDTSYYTPPAPSIDTSPISSYDPGPSYLDIGDFNRGGGVHEHRHHRAYGGQNIHSSPTAPTFGVAPVTMNYGMPTSSSLQEQAEDVAGAGVVPVSQGMQALASRDFLGGGGMYRGGVVRHRG